ncbi:hypothetical protein DO628_21140 [Salmonella enterica subsp. salamae]|nr:hypothetical protein [Salmonella enterica subsp. salamae serovar Sofia]EAW4593350.1 hypothetical protein [Salmonella enterica]ECI2511936.1 hypothetical protein [Salmonella enterica subsp. enterica serovar Paratyphi B]ECJ2395770.1 hypothetical protein [Salmonella enterica subsp. salamae]EDS8307792.1 hypothetical protein [Salmonella enterica subsp. enterica serovar Java]EDT7500934.1 hypothetical protein [Salmonella enterica subsp. enterica serovar Schleissheim]
MVFWLYFTRSHGVKTNEYYRYKEKKSFHFLPPLLVLCDIFPHNSPRSSIPAVAGPLSSLRSGNK